MVKLFDPQVQHSQIWMDLQEASPLLPLDHSTCLYFHLDTPSHWIQVKKYVSIAGSASEACKNADAIVIATEWKEFKELNWVDIYENMNKPAFLFDGRLLVDSEKLTKIGFKVSSFIIKILIVLTSRCFPRLPLSVAPRTARSNF